MEQQTKDKLSAVLSKESERRKAVANANKKHEIETQARNDRKKAAQERWSSTTQGDIRTAVADMNQQIASSGLSFSISDGDNTDRAIAQVFINLNPSPKNERRVVLNVSAYGTVSPVFLIPHSGQAPKAFEIAATNAETLSALLVDFLDQALAYEDTQTRRAVGTAA